MANLFQVGDLVYSRNPGRQHRDHDTVFRIVRILGSGDDTNVAVGFKDEEWLQGPYYRPGDFVLVSLDGTKRHGEKGEHLVPISDVVVSVPSQGTRQRLTPAQRQTFKQYLECANGRATIARKVSSDNEPVIVARKYAEDYTSLDPQLRLSIDAALAAEFWEGYSLGLRDRLELQSERADLVDRARTSVSRGADYFAKGYFKGFYCDSPNEIAEARLFLPPDVPGLDSSECR